MNKKRVAVVWGLLRLPLAVIFAYLLREPIIDAIERIFDVVQITLFAIGVLSTPFSRLVLAAALFCALSVAALVFRGGELKVRFWLLLGTGVILFGSLFYATTTSRLFACFALLLFATNLIPLAWIDTSRERARAVDRIVMLAVGVAEVFAFRRYVLWVAERAEWDKVASWARSERLTTLLPAFFIACVTAALLLNARYLVKVEQLLRSGPSVEVIAKGDFNWIQLDQSGKYLFATGHGVPRLRRYDLTERETPYLEAEVDTGAAQSFSYDPRSNELYVYSSKQREIIYLDAETLKKKRAVPVTGLSPGDPWIAVDHETDTLTIVSEADERSGHAFLVLRRSDGAILDSRHEEAGNILAHPVESLLYLSYFRRSNYVKAYDLRKLDIVLEAPSDRRVDRMEINAQKEELLLASPLNSEIIRYDSRSLVELGRLKSTLGIRVLAMDESRNVLLGGSLATGLISVIDMATGRIRETHYLGPWLRTIAVNEVTGLAYVSSNGSLFKLDYTHE